MTSTRVDITGAGATFPYPLYARWFNEYAKTSNTRINYQSIGSGAGIRQVVARTVDFGATDVPMTDSELSASKMRILHIPTVVGAVAITYNLPELSRPLNLSADVIADIFLGKLTKWNDTRLAALNPKVTLPASDILVVHRADGSGTSYIFSDYLTVVSPAWASGPGRGKEVPWPVGIGGKGNEGVAGQVKQMPGAIGYLEVVYARQNRLPVAHIRNQAGRFVSPMPFEIATAATSVLDRLATDRMAATDLRMSLVDAPGAQSYPIASFTWMLIAPDAIGPVKSHQMASFLRWALLENGDIASTLGYVPLPSDAAARVVDKVEELLSPSVARP
ncbi:MAG TPA: phosphate ABC transporter substrate-binding protein PstS [Gemmatimonas aurantiaca]|nr:phosphate ABC transporter substrate-binding protein PstS [Gemmatimonas aurantiaca]